MTSNIERQVMAGVGVIYAARLALSRTALELYVLAASAVVLWQLVWIHKVFANFFTVEKHGLGAIDTYLISAVEHTHLAVQITLLAAVLAGIGLIADAFSAIRSPSLRPSL